MDPFAIRDLDLRSLDFSREVKSNDLQDFTPRMHLSEEDFKVMTRGGALLDSEDQLCFENFEELMRDQIRQFVRRQLTNTLTVGPQCVPVETVQLSTIKAILHEQVFEFQICVE